MEDSQESTKRLEEQVKKLYPVTEEELKDNPSLNDLDASDLAYIGSMVEPEEGFPDGQMRRRVTEAPIGSKMGYHELGDEKEEGDMEWMLGEASQLSGAGSRGSRNWVLAIVLPVLMVIAIVCLHQWWWEVKKGASHVVNKVGDVFDRRALENIQQGAGGKHHAVTLEGGTPEKAVYSVNLKDGEAN